MSGADWLTLESRKLRDFYADASARGFAELTGIV